MEVGDQVPSMAGRTVRKNKTDDADFNLEQFSAGQKLVVVGFFPPGGSPFESLELNKKIEATEGLKVAVVCEPAIPEMGLRMWLGMAGQEITLPVLLDPKSEYANAFGVTSRPTVFFIQDGKVVEIVTEKLDMNLLDQKISSYLG